MKTILENGVTHNRTVASTDLIGTIDKNGSKRLISHRTDTDVLTVMTKYVVAPTIGLGYKNLFEYADNIVRNRRDNYTTVVVFHSNVEGFEWLLD